MELELELGGLEGRCKGVWKSNAEMVLWSGTNIQSHLCFCIWGRKSIHRNAECGGWFVDLLCGYDWTDA